MKANLLAPWTWGTRLSPFAREEDTSFYSLQREINRLFENFLTGTEIPSLRTIEAEASRYSPKVDVSDTEKEFIVSAELPGMTDKDINVSVYDNYLIIEGEKKEEKEETVKGHYRMERTYGAFHREIPLPEEVQVDKVDATFKNGVLRIVLPKIETKQEQAKKVTVKAAT